MSVKTYSHVDWNATILFIFLAEVWKKSQRCFHKKFFGETSALAKRLVKQKVTKGVSLWEMQKIEIPANQLFAGIRFFVIAFL